MIDYGNGIFAVEQQLVRAFLIVGSEKALLLDTGAVRMELLACIRKTTALPVTVILTHGDGDHIGNLQDFTDAYIHPNDRSAVLSHESCRGVRLHPLAEGASIDLGGRTLTVLFTPGHTAGSVCLLDKANRLLFAGDTISYGPVFMFGARRDMPGYLTTLRRLKQAKDAGAFTTVYCCHNVCPIPASAVEELIACTEGILDGSIAGFPAPMPLPMPGGDTPLLGKLGACSILF